MRFAIDRRAFVGGIGAAGLGGLSAMGQGKLALPSSPVGISVIDVGGALALLQQSLDAYRAKNDKLVSRITYSKAPAPELPAKLRAQQDAGRVDIDLVLGGLDVLSAGIDQKLWTQLLPDQQAGLPKLDEVLQPITVKMQELARGQAVVVVYTPSGPLLEYMPAKVKTVPTSTEELLAWTRQNKDRFVYARPANSGPGRTWLMGLPYLLGDKDPKDPEKGWDKTWAYLKALGENIEYYPAGTGAVMKLLGEGSRDMTVTTAGWDINPRAIGVVPKEAKVQALKGFHWVADAQYMMVPKGVSKDKLAVLLDMITWAMSPEQQATTYDAGYFYPGPARKDVPIEMAPEESRKVIAEYGRPEYAELMAKNPIEVPLQPDRMVAAFRIWDEAIGGAKRK
jgi:putative spermidine/putrescine transport system substrate-binding protein